jgi:GTPase Era involved in 16S rRNA processing
MTIATKEAKIRALGRIEACKSEIRALSDRLDQAPLWRPGGDLKRVFSEALAGIDELEARFDRKLVVTIIGACGAGKSTLLNALAGDDQLSPVGHARPTTRKPVILCMDKRDAAPVVERLGETEVPVRESGRARALEHVLLIDTPDTDSTEQEQHIPIVETAIRLSDVLICVFNSENPKRMDTVDFMAPYVARFTGESLVCVLNKADRQDEEELRREIAPEFLRHINASWDRSISAVLCISARRHLNRPDWDEKAPPRHDFDEFDTLREMVFQRFNDARFVVDRRMEQAKRFRNLAREALAERVSASGAHLSTAVTRMETTEAEAIRRAVDILAESDPQRLSEPDPLIYRRMAARWTGPMGWTIALWARLLGVTSGIAAAFRFRNPLSPLARSIPFFQGDDKSTTEQEALPDGVVAALSDFRLQVRKSWPDAAESLVRGGFEESVRRIETAFPHPEEMARHLADSWRRATERAVQVTADRLSGVFLQAVFNLPILATLVYIAWLTAERFFRGSYLSSAFFLHALVTLLLFVSIGFFLLQWLVRVVAGGDRIARKALADLRARIESDPPPTRNPVLDQARIVLSMLADPPQDSYSQPIIQADSPRRAQQTE